MSDPLYYFWALPTAIAFLIYGVSCLCTESMRLEFERFTLSQYRILIGITQLLAAVALLLAVRFPILGFGGAAGLAFQMGAGVVVRIRSGDTWLQTAQAVLFLIVNLILVIFFWREL